MKQTTALGYGVLSYGIFFATFLYLVGFLANAIVPKGIDSGEAGGLAAAMAVNTALLVLFGLQHSVMARPAFKAWWTRFVPRPVERSTYVLASSLALIALFVFWQPLPQTVWSLGGAAGSLFQGLFLCGVALVLYATFLIDHFDLFGLRQVFFYWRGREYEHKRFATPSLYRHIRHPLYVGWFITLWATPHMTLGHLLLALVMTGYVLVAIPMEERDLAGFLGAEYRRYRERTPMFVPRLRGNPSRPAGAPVGSR